MLLAVALVALMIMAALRGGGASIDARTVQDLVQDDLLSEFSETLDVSETRARQLYTQEQLEEAAEEAGVSREEFLRSTREVVVSVLQEAVDDDRINAEQAERALTMTMRAITNHL